MVPPITVGLKTIGTSACKQLKTAKVTEELIAETLELRLNSEILKNFQRATGEYNSETFEFAKKLKQAGLEKYLITPIISDKTQIVPSKFEPEAFKAFMKQVKLQPLGSFGDKSRFLKESVGQHGEFSAQDLKEITAIFEKYNKQTHNIWTAFNFREFTNIKSIEELSLQEKNKFLTKLVSNGFNDKVAKDIPILPKTKEEYQKMIQQLLDETSLKVKPLAAAEQKTLISTLSDLSKTGGEISETQIKQILKAFPEIKTADGKISDSSIELLKKINKDGRFAELSKDDKLIIQLAALFKDSSTIHGIQDIEQSAFNAYYLAEKLNLPHESKLKLYALVKNQNTLEEAMQGNISVAALETAGCELRHNGSYKMFEIFSDAKNKGNIPISGETLNSIKSIIQKKAARINNTIVHIPQSNVPKASQFIINGDSVQKVTKGGVENIVVYLDRKTPIKYIDETGAEKILKPDDVHNFYHATNCPEGVSLAARPNSQYAISSSYSAPTQGSHNLFNTEGVILNMNDADIYYAKIIRDSDGTGFGKSISANSFFPKAIDEKFANLDKVYQQYGCKSLEELRQTNPQAAEELHKAIVDAVPKFEYGEAIGAFAQPSGVFFQGPYKGYSPMYSRHSEHQMSTVDKLKAKIYKLFGREYKETYKFKDVPLNMREYANQNDFAVFHLGD